MNSPRPFLLISEVLLLLLTWALVANGPVHAGFIPKPSICTYTETTGSEMRQFLWTLQEDGGWVLTSKDQQEVHRAWLDQTLNTRRWTLERPATDTLITASRQGTTLLIEGTRNGKAYRHAYPVGEQPWYQALSLSLRNHLGETSPEREFWLIRPDNFDLQRLQISSIVEEPLQHDAKNLATYHVVIRPAGWKAPFWKGEYWFRKDDGHFLRYCGDSGPPGSPSTIVEPSDDSLLQNP